jgi:Flp pilus assembly protein TadD
LVELSAFPSNAVTAVLRDRLKDIDPMVRIAPVRDLASQQPAIQWLNGLLDDPVLAVRQEVGRALAGVDLDQVSADQRVRLEHLFRECESMLRLDEDRPEGRANLAIFLMRRNRAAEAEEELIAGLRLDPKASELSVNLADLYRATTREDLAVRTLQDALTRAPENAAAHHALGLALVRRQNYPEALDHLAQAATLAPDDARFAYVYGVALKSLGKPEEGRAILRKALELHPWDAALLNARISEALASHEFEAAAPLAESLTSLRPNDQDLAQLAAKLAGQ